MPDPTRPLPTEPVPYFDPTAVHPVRDGDPPESAPYFNPTAVHPVRDHDAPEPGEDLPMPGHEPAGFPPPGQTRATPASVPGHPIPAAPLSPAVAVSPPAPARAEIPPAGAAAPVALPRHPAPPPLRHTVPAAPLAPQSYGAPPAPNSVGYAHHPGALPVPAPPLPVIAQVGDVRVTSTTIYTPTGEIPLRGSQWLVTDQWQATQKTPTWAVVLAIVLFFCLTVFSLLFLLAKEVVYTGMVQVVITNGARQYVTRIPVTSQAQVTHVHQQVNYVRSLAGL